MRGRGRAPGAPRRAAHTDPLTPSGALRRRAMVAAVVAALVVVGSVLTLAVRGGDGSTSPAAVDAPRSSANATPGSSDPAAASGTADGSVPGPVLLNAPAATSTPAPGAPAGVGIAGGRAVPLSVEGARPPEKDVVIGSCGVQAPQSWPQAAGTVTNTSSIGVDYAVSIGFFGPDGAQVGSASTSLSAIAPGAAKQWQVTSLRPVTASISCQVLSVSRTQSHSAGT